MMSVVRWNVWVCHCEDTVIAALTFDCVRGTGPVYLKQVICPVSDLSRRSLCSAGRGDLFVSRANTSIGHQSFSIAAPVVWSALPHDLRSPHISRRQFRSKLKTHLFPQAYNTAWLLWEQFFVKECNCNCNCVIVRVCKVHCFWTVVSAWLIVCLVKCSLKTHLSCYTCGLTCLVTLSRYVWAWHIPSASCNVQSSMDQLSNWCYCWLNMSNDTVVKCVVDIAMPVQEISTLI